MEETPSQVKTLALPGFPMVVQLDGSDLEAVLVYTPISGVTWSESAVPALLSALSRAGLQGIDPLTLRAALPAVVKGRPYVLARGIEPVDGKSGEIHCFFESDVAEKCWEADAKEPVDFRHIADIASVERGDLLAELLPPIPEVNGLTVFGKPILARPVRDVRMVAGANVALDPDETKAYAVEAGSAKLVGNRLSVDPVKIIRGNVDFRHGCIDFVGDVVVQGDVLETFSVTAGGSITINGSVERANLKAGGEIIVREGLYGKEGVKVEAEGNISVGFAENAEIVTRQNLYVSNSMINCTAKVMGKLFLKAIGKSLVGGYALARGGVVAGTLGNPNVATKTIVEFGPDPEMAREIKNLDTEFNTAADDEQRLAILERREDLVDTLARHAQARVVARLAVFAGVEIVNGRLAYPISAPTAGVCFYRLPGRNHISVRAYAASRSSKLMEE